MSVMLKISFNYEILVKIVAKQNQIDHYCFNFNNCMKYKSLAKKVCRVMFKSWFDEFNSYIFVYK